MYVCICNEVTDKQIKHATSTGISSMKELRTSLSVGTSCGQCSDCAKNLLKECLSSSANLAQQPF